VKGAYGLRLSGRSLPEALLDDAPGDWPALELVRRVGTAPGGDDQLGPERASIRLIDDGRVEIERDPGRATFITRRPLGDDELVHPYLGLAAAVYSRWLGRESFHAGAFEAGRGAWIVAGEKAAGKSTLLASLALRGRLVLADDVVVLDGGEALAGPRSIDLRADTAAALGVGEDVTAPGGRERWRLALPGAGARVPVAGWVFPAWADGAPEVVPVPPNERLVRFAGSRVLRIDPDRPELLVKLAALPAWELRRSHGWDGLGEALDLLLSALGS
jgi:hypothetical protein